ncbi:MAG: hypothetical protein ACKVW3_11910 [Phycisphaerales bacterium]
MTNPNKSSPNTQSLIRCVAIVAACAGIVLAGCEKKKKAPPPPPPAPKPVAVIPDPVDVGAVLQQAKADARVQFPQTQAPADRSLAEGVIKLASALAAGDAPGMRPMLTPGAQAVLDQLVADGGWAEGTKEIGQVRVVSLSNTTESAPTSSLVGFAIQEPGRARLLAWSATRTGDRWVFGNELCQPDTKPRASDFDGVSLDTSIGVSESDFREALNPERNQTPRPGTPAPSGGGGGSPQPGRGNTPGSGS